MFVLLGRLRPAVTSAAWCLHSSTWCGPHCFWSGGRGEELSWRINGGHWTHRLNPWRNHGLSSGWVELILPSTCPPLHSPPLSGSVTPSPTPSLCRESSAVVLSQDARSSTILRGGGVFSGGWSACPSVSCVSVLSSWSCSSVSSCRSVSCLHLCYRIPCISHHSVLLHFLFSGCLSWCSEAVIRPITLIAV